MPKTCYPIWADSALGIEDFHESTDPFLFAATAHGCISRLSPTGLINVNAGGTSVRSSQWHPTPNDLLEPGPGPRRHR